MNKKIHRTLFFKEHPIAIIAIIITLFIFIIWYIWFRPIYDQRGLPLRNVSYEFVSSRPEAKLYYPNAKVFSLNGQPQRGPNTIAFAGAILTSSDPPKMIYQWYHDWLLAHGWQKDDRAILGKADTMLSVESYTKDGKGLNTREVFIVAINRPASLSETLGRPVPTNVTVFEMSYMIRSEL